MLRRLAIAALRLRGWRLCGKRPALRKYLIILAPHTCNWDLLLGLLAAAGFGLKTSWLGKDAIFRWPMAGVLRHLGGIPVRRNAQEGIVGQVVAAYAAADALVIGITPEGTRRSTPHWKSGFYYMALGAGVPVVPASIDRVTRRITLGPPLELSGDPHRDMEAIRLFYANARGIHSEKAGVVRLSEEADPPRRT
jgi:1-acyl-sn-glycerol-3-phosphate acyltransferase